MFLSSSAEFVFILLFHFHHHTSSGDTSAVPGLPQLYVPGSDGLVWVRQPLLPQHSRPCRRPLQPCAEQDWHELPCRRGLGEGLAGAAAPAPGARGGEPERGVGLRQESPDGSGRAGALHLPAGHVPGRAHQVGVLGFCVTSNCFAGSCLVLCCLGDPGVNSFQNGTRSTACLD